MIKKESIEDRFGELLIKEKELSYVTKNHVMASFKCIAKELKEKEDNISRFQKMLLNIEDFFDYLYLKYLKMKNKRQLRSITDNDKKTQVIKHKKKKSKDLYFHYYIIKRFQSHILKRNCACTSISNFEYVVCLKVEYSEILTKNYFEKTFDKEEDAINYFYELLEKNKKKDGNQIFNSIVTEVDNEITFILEHTKYLESKLDNNC